MLYLSVLNLTKSYKMSGYILTFGHYSSPNAFAYEQEKLTDTAAQQKNDSFWIYTANGCTTFRMD